jgi:hypothetical protein
MPGALALLLMLAVLSQGEACRKAGAGKVTGGRTQSAQAGMWGGDHVRLDVAEGGAKHEYDCAPGAIDEPFVAGGDGRFELTGVFVRERGGPVRQGQEPEPLPARYAGRIERDAMTLSVTLTETGQEIGTFTLTRGKAGRLMKCL